MLVRLTGLNDQLYFMVSMRNNLIIRQCALVSSEGIIHNHSPLFGELFNIKISLKVASLSDVFPSLDFKALNFYEPLMMTSKENTVLFVKCIKKLKDVDIIYVLLIIDPHEIEKWMNNEASEQLDYFGISNFIDETNVNFPKNVSIKITEPSQVKFDELKSLHFFESDTKEKETSSESPFYKPSSNNEDKSLTSNGMSSTSGLATSNYHIDRGKRILTETENTLKRFRIVLLIFVISVIISNGVLCLYVVKFAQHSQNSNALTTLGSILVNIVSIADVSRYIDFGHSLNFNTTEIKTNLIYTRDQLSIYQDKLLDDISL